MTCNGGLESAIGQWLLFRSSPLMSSVRGMEAIVLVLSRVATVLVLVIESQRLPWPTHCWVDAAYIRPFLFVSSPARTIEYEYEHRFAEHEHDRCARRCARTIDGLDIARSISHLNVSSPIVPASSFGPSLAKWLAVDTSVVC